MQPSLDIPTTGSSPETPSDPANSTSGSCTDGPSLEWTVVTGPSPCTPSKSPRQFHIVSRRRRPVFQQNFKFVDLTSTDPRSKKEAQCHAMREWKRGKKWYSLQRLRDRNYPPKLDQTTSASQEESPKQHGDLDNGEVSGDGNKYGQATETTKPTRRRMEVYLQPPHCEASAADKGSVVGKSPKISQMPISLSPFATLPVNLNQEGKNLTHAYISVVPKVLFGAQTGRTFTPVQDFFFLFSTNSASYNIFLSYSSVIMANLRGEQDPWAGLVYKTKAIQLINNAIRDPAKQYTEGLFTAVNLLAYVELRLGNQEVAKIHVKGVNQILRGRGGLPSLRHNPRLDAAATLLQLATSADMADDIRITATPQDALSLAQSYKMLLNLLSDAERMGRLPFDPSASSRSQKLEEALNELFQPGKTAHSMLSSLGPSPHAIIYSTGGKEKTLVRNTIIQQSMKLGSLIYLVMMMWEYRYSPNKVAFVLKEFNIRLIEENVVGIDMFAWHLIKDMDGKPERKWKMLEVLKVVELLSFETKDILRSFLLSCLEPAPSRQVAPQIATFIPAVWRDFTQALPLELKNFPIPGAL